MTRLVLMFVLFLIAFEFYFPMDKIRDGFMMGDVNIVLYNNPTLVNGNALSFNGIDQ